MSDSQLQAHVMHLRARLDDKDVELRTLRADAKNSEALIQSLRSEINSRQLDKEIRISTLEQQVRFCWCPPLCVWEFFSFSATGSHMLFLASTRCAR